MIVRGALIILIAAFVWGMGNFVTGFTAQKYLSSGSLYPAVDIALANTLGGLIFLAIILIFRKAIVKFSSNKDETQSFQRIWIKNLNKQSILSGALKGANTCLFVFSTTFIAATQSLIFESTYIIWSFLLSFLFLLKRVPLLSTVFNSILLFIGVIFVSGQTSVNISTGTQSLGFVFGIAAGLSYALYLFFWSQVTDKLNDFESRALSTTLLLTISLLTIILMTETISYLFLRSIWIPFTNLDNPDIVLQVTNGIFVIGLVYLLITIGMSYLRNAPEGASLITALGLSFSIPFTLIPEFVIGKFVPTGLQLVGVFLFMFGFVSISVSLSKAQKNIGEAYS